MNRNWVDNGFRMLVPIYYKVLILKYLGDALNGTDFYKVRIFADGLAMAQIVDLVLCGRTIPAVCFKSTFGRGARSAGFSLPSGPRVLMRLD